MARASSSNQSTSSTSTSPFASPPAEQSASNGARRRTTRLTADLPARDAATLAEVADETGFNKVTTLVRAIRVLAELVRAENAGGELTIKYADGRRERLIIR